MKLIALLLLGSVLFFSPGTGICQVASKTVIEGAVQRAVVAPFDGYIVGSRARGRENPQKGVRLIFCEDKR